MKFVISLIYVLSVLLLCGLLGEYIYFSALQQQQFNPQDNTLANISLLLFVFAVLIISLVLIWLENLPDSTSQAPLDKYLDEVRSAQEKASHPEVILLSEIAEKLEQVSRSLSGTNKTLNLGLENMNTRLDDIENASLSKNYPPRNHTEATKIADKYIEQEMLPKLQKIFNQDLASTLASLEIMQKDSAPETPDNRPLKTPNQP